MAEDKTFSAREVAEQLGVHKTTILRWVHDGHFPNAYQVGLKRFSPYVIPQCDIDAFLEARRNRQENDQE